MISLRFGPLELRIGNEDITGIANGERITKNTLCGGFKVAQSTVEVIRCKPKLIKGQFVTVQKYELAQRWVMIINELDVVAMY